MAFSQVQCLDDSHVNWRSSESKPEFFYSEEQRLALEALVSKGPEAFYEVLKKENIRDFLSELELKKILETLETYDPGSEYIPRGDENSDFISQNGEQGPLPSLEYWPQRSDRSIPQLDLGWPETIAYRGVTRATVYMQPPIDCQPHIKEVVRKMIFQAQKVVAVVMDMFTDVDIFKDLLEASFKRKVAIYIILDETNLKYFLQMCERAQMHTGHLKNLRVRTTGGTEFFTRSATRFKGALAQKFMFVDGDKAMNGSYSFTWSAARTDRNVISVLSGQVVEAFDKQFQELYLLSRGVSLKSIPMDEEPEPEPVILPSVIPVTPANAVVKKLVNPKYALVKAKSAEQITNSNHASSDRNLTEKQRAETKGKAIPEGRVSERPNDLMEIAPPIHPGLLNLEKANMFDYLPTWVEPDPEPSEVLGYINIIDPKIKNIQLSQMNRIKVCDISQANAQHRQMLKQKMESVKKNQSNQPTPVSPCHLNTFSSSVQIQQAPDPTGQIQQAPDPTGQIQQAPDPTEQIQKAPDSTKQIQKAPDPTGEIQQAPDPMEQIQQGPDSTEQIQKAPDPVGQIQEAPEPSPTGKTQRKPKNGDAFATLAISAHLKQPPHTKVHDQIQDNGITTPVPKPRTVHVTDFISMKSVPAEGGAAKADDTQTQQPETDSATTKRNESPAKAEATGSHCKLTRQEAVSQKAAVCPTNGVQGGEAEEDEEDVYLTVSDQGSLSGSSTTHSHQHSSTSSISDECFEGPQFFCYGSRVQVSAGRGQSSIPPAQQGKIPGERKYQRDGARVKKDPSGPGSQQHWPNKGFGLGKNTQPSRLLQGTGSFPKTTRSTLSPFQESQRISEEIRTPLGIPLSKLSQSKHLKNRACQLSDPKRKPHGTTSRKDQ
ncbi:protein FAM83G isoform X2 [Eublepharis macularius]|uniref:Protein FAM83G isoform X2 n=1 Tax=Eublepharis macularius TaxID=481883 RepID=A0AA97LAM9_EUBMA|nr:protein FAM83G isoform X2 [Eublepharis macularius]